MVSWCWQIFGQCCGLSLACTWQKPQSAHTHACSSLSPLELLRRGLQVPGQVQAGLTDGAFVWGSHLPAWPLPTQLLSKECCSELSFPRRVGISILPPALSTLVQCFLRAGSGVSGAEPVSPWLVKGEVHYSETRAEERGREVWG